MTYDVTATFMREQTKIDNVYPVNMYIVNASLTGENYLYYVDSNQSIVGYQVDSNGELTSATQLYTGIPIDSGNIGTNTTGQIGEVSVSIPNTDRIIENYIQNVNYLRGHEIIFVTAFAKHLPASSSPTHIGESGSEDYNAAITEKLFIDSTSSNETAVTFSCKPKFIIKNVILPGRRYSRECQWDTYLGTECDPLGKISIASECPRTLTACQFRNNATQFGGFPSIPRVARYI